MANDSEYPSTLSVTTPATGMDPAHMSEHEAPLSPSATTAFHTPMHEEPTIDFLPVRPEVTDPSNDNELAVRDGGCLQTPESTASFIHVPAPPAPSASTTGPSTPIRGPNADLSVVTPSRYEAATALLAIGKVGIEPVAPKEIEATINTSPVPTTVEAASLAPPLPPKTNIKSDLSVDTSSVYDSWDTDDLPPRSSSLPENRGLRDLPATGGSPCFETCPESCVHHKGEFTSSPNEIVTPGKNKAQEEPKDYVNYYANDPYAERKDKKPAKEDSPLPKLPESPLPKLPEPTEVNHQNHSPHDGHGHGNGHHDNWMRRLFRKMKL